MKDYILPRGGLEREVFRKHCIKEALPMTTDILRQYLTDAVNHEPYGCTIRPVMLGNKPLKRAYIRDRSIVLDHEGDTHLVIRKPGQLIRYLTMCTAGIFQEMKDKPVKIGEDNIVNAHVDGEGHIILMTFHDQLMEWNQRDHERHLAKEGNNE